MQTYKGRFKPKNFSKYKGDPTGIVYRSGWERRVMRYLDYNDNVIEWSSEEFCIPYYDPVRKKIRRYFPDFWVRVKTKSGEVKTLVLEVKPSAQTKEPRKRGKLTKKYIQEVAVWGTNQAKFQAANDFCKDRKWEFKLVTEKELGI